MSEKTITRARVALTVEMDLGATWGPECQLSQVYSQAEESARNILRNSLGQGIRVVGEAKVTAITTDSR